MAVMQGAKRVWRDNSEFKGKADAEKVQDEINLVASQDPNGKCRNEDLVAFARNHPFSETHKCFEWNDTAAAEKYRLHQASRIKCEIMTISVNPAQKQAQKQTQMIEVVTNHSLPTPGDGHKDIMTILKNKADTAALDQDMYNSIRVYVANFEKRYMLAPSFAPLMKELQKIVAGLP